MDKIINYMKFVMRDLCLEAAEFQDFELFAEFCSAKKENFPKKIKKTENAYNWSIFVDCPGMDESP